MSYIGVPPQATFSSGLLDRFTSTTGTTVTLTHDIASENDIVVFVNFVKQDSTTYSVGGTGNKTLTLGGTLVSSDIVEVHYLNIVGQTNAPSAGSVTTATINDLAVTGAKLNTDVISAQTELATAPASTDELLVSDAGVLKRVDVSLVGGNNTPAFSAYINSDQTLSDNTDTKVNFDTEDFDSDSAYDVSNKRFTVPSGQAGKYFFYVRGRFYMSANQSQFVIAIRKNGSEVAKRYVYSGSTGTKIFNSTTYYSYDISAVETLSVGDYVEAWVKADDTGGNTISFQNGTIQSEFSGFKLIGV